MFCARSFLELTFSLTKVAISSIMTSMPELLVTSSIPGDYKIRMLMKLAAEFPFGGFLNFSFPLLPHFVVSLLNLFPLLGLELFYLFPFSIGLCFH